MDYTVTGMKGNGKGILMVARMREVLLMGCRVATNMDICLQEMFPYGSDDYKALLRVNRHPEVIRIPDFPSGEDLWSLGSGGVGKDDRYHGHLFLDELAVWLNSRGFGDQDRVTFIEALPQTRKMHWHTYLTTQHVDSMDRQARNLLQHRVHVTRTDHFGLPIPFIGPVLRMLFGRIRLPRFHIGTVCLGNDKPPHVVQTWRYRADPEIINAYDTDQLFSARYPHGAYCYLHGGYFVDRTVNNNCESSIQYYYGEHVSGTCLPFGTDNAVGGLYRWPYIGEYVKPEKEKFYQKYFEGFGGEARPAIWGTRMEYERKSKMDAVGALLALLLSPLVSFLEKRNSSQYGG